VDPVYVKPFVEELNNKKWERFNSLKICSICYAKLEGREAIIHHFENSSVMNKNVREENNLVGQNFETTNSQPCRTCWAI